MSALILMYHDLSEKLQSVSAEHRPYVLPASRFDYQLQSVVRSNLPVLTIAEWCSTPKRLRGLIFTFDDGHVSNHETALPILKRFGFKATFFITAGRIGVGDTMNWSQIRDLHAAGMEIGSHTVTHRAPSTLNDKELRYELLESRRILEDGLGAPVTSISSPTGFYNARMRDIAKEVGYRALCIGRVGLIATGTDPYSLNRIAVKASLNNNIFDALLKFDRKAIGRMRVQQWLRERARESLGPAAYLGMRQFIMRGVTFLQGNPSQERK